MSAARSHQSLGRTWAPYLVGRSRVAATGPYESRQFLARWPPRRATAGARHRLLTQGNVPGAHVQAIVFVLNLVTRYRPAEANAVRVGVRS
jgi:hypothetical protein